MKTAEDIERLRSERQSRVTSFRRRLQLLAAGTRPRLNLSLSQHDMLTRQICRIRPQLTPLGLKPGLSSVRHATTTTVPAPGTADPNAYCLDFVQKRDYEGFLVGQFYPREVRNSYFALRAFYVGDHSYIMEQLYS
jgi:hypothetical protein